MTGVDLCAARWRKSSYSGGGNDDNCVEVASMPAAIALRDSKAPHGGVLTVAYPAWTHLRVHLGGESAPA